MIRSFARFLAAISALAVMVGCAGPVHIQADGCARNPNAQGCARIDLQLPQQSQSVNVVTSPPQDDRLIQFRFVSDRRSPQVQICLNEGRNPAGVPYIGWTGRMEGVRPVCQEDPVVMCVKNGYAGFSGIFWEKSGALECTAHAQAAAQQQVITVQPAGRATIAGRPIAPVVINSGDGRSAFEGSPVKKYGTCRNNQTGQIYTGWC